MRIKVRTGGLLRRYLPEGSRSNEAVITVAASASVYDVMTLLDLPMNDPYLITLNGEVVVEAARATTMLGDNDDLGVFPPLKGG